MKLWASLVLALYIPAAHSQGLVLYGASAGVGSLYQINTANGNSTLVAALHDVSNNAFGLRSLSLDSSNQLWGATSSDSPTSPNSLVRVNPFNALVTVVGPLNAPSGGTATGIGFETNGTLIGWFGGSSSYGTINKTTGQVTLLSGPGVLIGGLEVSPVVVVTGSDTFSAGAVLSVTATSQSPGAALRFFDTGSNTSSTAIALTGAPCCTFTALEISGTGTIFGLANGILVTIPPSGQVAAVGAVAAGVVALSFGPPPVVSVTVSPPSATLIGGQTQQFTATVIGGSSSAVTWSIPPGAPGSISATGLYTAPASAPSTTFSVTATSQADSSKSGTATVTLNSTLTPVPAPPSLWLAAIGLVMAALWWRRFRAAGAL